MASEDSILAEATIREVIVPGRYYRADLPNGKSVNAHTPKKWIGERLFAPGDTVTLEMTPYDFSKGRIRFSADTENS